MSKYYIRVDGPASKRLEAVSETIADVKSEAVKHLGSILMENPGFVDDGHWRLFVEDEAGIQIMHIIVAMVAARGAAPDGNDRL